jgi:hypothetical protein
MKKLVLFLVPVCLVAACDGEQTMVAAKCTPSVRVTIESAGGKPKAARPQQREVVQVYWDVSKSMRDFPLRPVVAALDGGVLLSAHAQVVEQYGVGESIRLLSTAGDALRPTANRTALHLAAERIGTALAGGNAQAAIVVSDLQLDTPPHTTPTVCNGVPLPSTREAGSLFGRCFENAVASDGLRLTRTNLLVHVFRKSIKGRELFILLFATNRAFGRRISDEMVSRLDFSRQVIFDSGVVAASNVHGCTLTAPSSGVLLHPASGCVAKCFDTNASIQASCDLRSPVNDAWITPGGRGLDGVTYERGLVRFAIPCSTPPGRFDASVSFPWHSRAAKDFAQNASVRDLFASLADAIVRTVAPRRLHIGIDLAKGSGGS